MRLEPLEPRRMLNAGPLEISEFLADNNSGLQDGDGFFSDWIEIHNPTDQPVVLDGWYLTDDANNLNRWSFPDTNPDTTLGPGEYLVVFASGGRSNVVPAPADPNVDPAGNLHTSFQLDANGEYLGLVLADGVTISDDFDAAFPRQYEDFSYGTAHDVSEYVGQGDDATFRVPTAADAGADWTDTGYDDSTWVESIRPDGPGVLITEIDNGTPDWLEIQNVSDVAKQTAGWIVAVNDASSGNINDVNPTHWSLPASMSSGELLYRTDQAGPDYWGSDISWDASHGWVMILDQNGEVVDFLPWGYSETQIAGMSIDVGGFTDISVGGQWTGPGPAAIADTWNHGAPPPGSGNPGQDVGSVAAAGSHTYSAGAYTLEGSGRANWPWSPDEFYFVHQTLTGDSEITARVTSIENTEQRAKAGVMIRESMAANSKHAMIVVTPGNGVSFQYRSSTGGWSSNTTTGGLSAPYWVKLIRQGDTFTGYRSDDGANWTEVNSRTISMSSTVEVGLVVTSHNDGTLCTAEFTNVTLGGSVPPSKVQRIGDSDNDNASDFFYPFSQSQGSQNDDLTVPFPIGPSAPVVTGLGFDRDPSGGDGQFDVMFYKANVAVDHLNTAWEVINDPARQTYSQAADAAVINYFNTGGQGNYAANNTFPSLTIGADTEDFVIRATASVVIPAPGYWTFGVNSDDGFELTLDNGTDTFYTSYPTPRGPADTLGVFNISQSGAYDLELVFYERGGGSGVELFAAPGSHATFNPAAFDLVGDVANGGLALGGGLGGGVQTNVEDAMYNVNSTLWLRVPFVIEEDPGTLDRLTLRMMYNDGFVAYLNGTKIAEHNAPGTPAWNSAATGTRSVEETGEFFEFDATAHQGLLAVGTNLLAIHALNVAADDDNFLVLPELVAAHREDVLQYFDEPTPAAENGSGYVDFVTDTAFSHRRGFYTAPFDVIVTTDTPLAEIYYTTDGSEPSTTNSTKYTGPIHVDGTTVLRAAAFKGKYYPTNVDTQTYLFLADVIDQDSTPPEGWPTGPVNGQVLRYGMSTSITNHPTWGPQMEASLMAIPTMSLVTDVDNMFGQSNGIYVNPENDGYSWERPTSLELIYPEDTSADPDGFPDGIDGGFQVDAGVRLRGGYSRSTNNPKHAFRLFFRNEYGDGKLNYALFGDEGTDSFDKIDLRTTQNYSWAWNSDSTNTFLRDVFGRDAQGEMGQPYSRSRYYHLYINGEYWGMYQTQERSEAAYAEEYFGGNREDYDVVKHYGNRIYRNNMTDGNWDAFTRLYNAAMAGFSTDEAYYGAQGLDPVTHERDPAREQMIDVDNVIDYMIGVFYSGDRDAPISNFISNSAVNNYFGVYNREDPDGWKWFRHDGEHTLDKGMEDRTGPWTHSNFNSRDYFNPQILHQKLVAHADYRMRFADHVHKHFHNGGVFDPATAQASLQYRADQIDTAIIAHSARWGQGNTKNTWLGAVNTVKNWFNTGFGAAGSRTEEVISRLRSDGWYPSINAPSFNQHGGSVTPPFALSISAAAGTIYYTDDGTDPRLPGGDISASAQVYSGQIPINQSSLIKARARSGSQWSAVNEAQFFTDELAVPDNLVVTEINYHAYDPLAAELATQDPGDTPFVDNDFEFVELVNLTTDTPVDLTGVAFVDGIDFAFDDGRVHTLGPQERVVVVKNEAAFEARYGTGHNVAGAYGGNLSNGGERLQLEDALGASILYFEYNDANAWPGRPDGKGAALVLNDPAAVPADDAQLRTDYLEDGDNWRSSVRVGGTPGAVPEAEIGIVINEVLSHTDFPLLDAIELHNTTAVPIDVGGWYLSDSWGWEPLVVGGNNDNYKKYRIRTDAPQSTTIQPGGYLLFDENDFNPTPGAPLPNHFALDGAEGDDVWLMASDPFDPTGTLTHFGDHVEFGAQANGESWGRWPDGTGRLYPMNARTLDTQNTAGPRLGDAIISELHYNPGTMFNADELEFVEIYNTTGADIDLTNWRLRKGVEYDFAAGSLLAAFSTLVIVPFDPILQPDRLTDFVAEYQPAEPIDVVGPYLRQLDNGGERVQLQRPDQPPVGQPDFYPGLLEDEVIYDDEMGWPIEADGQGSSLHRTAADVWGNTSASWEPLDPSPGSVPWTPGVLGDFDHDGDVDGDDFLVWQTGFGTMDGATHAQGDADGDGDVDGDDFLTWQQNFGSGFASDVGGGAALTADETLSTGGEIDESAAFDLSDARSQPRQLRSVPDPVQLFFEIEAEPQAMIAAFRIREFVPSTGRRAAVDRVWDEFGHHRPRTSANETMPLWPARESVDRWFDTPPARNERPDPRDSRLDDLAMDRLGFRAKPQGIGHSDWHNAIEELFVDDRH